MTEMMNLVADLGTVSGRKDFLCIGHRGASGHEPENTLRSVRRALELGVDGIEVDVQLVEGELVVFHDARLQRTTNGRGLLARQSFAQLRTLDAGKGEQIPTLREVCDTVGRRAFLNVELKGRLTARPVARLIEEYVASRGWAYHDFIVSSFSRRELSEFRAVAHSAVPVGLLLARPGRWFVHAARKFGSVAVHPALRFTTQQLVDQAHAAGLKVFVYTVNQAEQVARMRAMGVDAVFTDFPELVVSR
jgi:glycerophosphoryl diester phosphodiesterase